MTVSVLMPVYNTAENILRESIESILQQSFSDFELLICDDGSFSSPEAVVVSFNDPRIKFLRNEKNLGVAKTRNRLMDAAQGEYIAWQDADDISLPERLEKQAEFLDAHPDFSGVSAWMESFPRRTVRENPEHPALLDFLGGCKFTQGCAMLRIKDLRDNGLRYDDSLKTSEDYDLWARAAVKGLKFANLQEVLLMYRRVAGSLVHSQGDAGAQADRRIKNFILEQLTADPVLREKIAAAVARFDRKKCSPGEWLFSIRNQWYGLKKVKILQIFGLRIKLAAKTVEK